MQKYILLALTIPSASTYAMETYIPHIVYNINTATKTNPLAIKLSQKFTPISECPKEKEPLCHQSPQVTCIHSQTYLDNLDKHPSIMLAAINNKAFMSLYPNIYSKSYFAPMLNNVSTTLAATECVITTNDSPQFKPNYAIALDEGYSFAGYAQGSNGDVYAPIPMAAAYALSTDSIKRILVIDENVTPKTAKDYFDHGNGSIFYPKNNPELSDLFGKKIITHNQPSKTLWDFLHKPDNDIGLAFYNINIDDFDVTDERKLKITSLLYSFIPTVFILSGDKDTYQDAVCSIIDHLVETARKIISFINAPEPYRATLSPIKNSESTSSRSRALSVSDDAEQEWQQCHLYYTDETSSSDSGDCNTIRVFKITTDLEKTLSFDGANRILFAHKITIDNDGIMEVDLCDYSTGYHSPSSSSRDSDSILSHSENHVEELIFKLNNISDGQ